MVNEKSRPASVGIFSVTKQNWLIDEFLGFHVVFDAICGNNS